MTSPAIDVKLNIIVIDDHQLLTQSLENLLRKYAFTNDVKTFNNPREYLRTKLDWRPDIIITDIRMPHMSGIDFLSVIRKRNRKVKLIILSSIVEANTISHAISAGANAYLGKDSNPEELYEAIISVINNEKYISVNLRKMLLRNPFSTNAYVFNLSPREKEVLRLVCSGKSIREAALEMELSFNTVQSYFRTILNKLKMTSTADLIVFAIQNGLYDPVHSN